MAGKKHSRTTGLDGKRADILDVWINENSDISLLVFPGSTTLEDVVTVVIITPGLLL